VSENLQAIAKEETTMHANDESNSLRTFLILLTVGFLVILGGIIILAIASSSGHNGSASFGAVIFIGPFPIIVGAGPDAVWMVLFGLAFTVLSIVMLLLAYGKLKKTGS
jgi:uncharacterized membrane protein